MQSKGLVQANARAAMDAFNRRPIGTVPMHQSKQRDPADHFGTPQQRLEYLIDLIKQLQSMSAADYPTVSRHLEAAGAEAGRLANLRSR